MLTSLLIIIFFVFLFLSFYFSGIEAGFLSLNREKFLAGIKTETKRNRQVRNLVNNTVVVLTVALLGNNLSNITLVVVSNRLWNGFFGLDKQALFVVCSTLLFLIVGEIVPKIFFRRLSYGVFHEVAYVLAIFYRFTAPLIHLITKFTDPIVNKLFNVSETGLTRKDLSDLVVDGHEQGALEEREKLFIENFANLSNTRVEEMMTPLVDVFMVSKNQDLKEIVDQVKNLEVDVLPVYDKRIDNIIGFVSLTEVYFLNKKKLIARDFLKKCSYIPESVTLEKISDNFSLFTEVPLVVINEHGGCSGVIYSKNFLANLFGFSYDLQVKHKESLIEEVSKGTYIIDPSFDMDNFNRLFQKEIEKDGFETLGGFLSHLEGKVPKTGSVIHYDNLIFKIIKADQVSLEEIEMVVLEES